METVLPKLLPLLTTAAELRAAGGSWAKVAEHVGRSPETCRQWARRFPETWCRLFHEAEGHLIAEGGSEARAILRTILRAKDPKVALAAAQMLLRSREAQRAREEQMDRPGPARVAAEVVELAKYLKGLNDEQLNAHLDAYLARRDAAGGGAGAGTADPPGPTQPQ